jgi:hypothetical protein
MKLKKSNRIKSPIIFNSIKIIKNLKTSYKLAGKKNTFYTDNEFSPSPFYKPIIKF